MNGDKNPEHRDDEALRQELERAKNNAEKRANIGASLQQDGTEICDWVNLGLRSLTIAPPNWDRQTAIEYTRRLNEHLEQQHHALENIVSVSGTVYYSTASVTGTLTPLTSVYLQQLQPPQQAEAREILIGYYNLAQRHNYRERVISLFHTLGFEKSTQGQLAIHQFNMAWDMHLQNTGSATASLLPLREAIDVSIGELLHLRQRQEESRPDKVTKILSQLAASHVSPSDMERLQARYLEIQNKLSGVKNKKVTRNEENTQMVEATLFLTQLLTAIDLEKLRR